MAVFISHTGHCLRYPDTAQKRSATWELKSMSKGRESSFKTTQMLDVSSLFWMKSKMTTSARRNWVKHTVMGLALQDDQWVMRG